MILETGIIAAIILFFIKDKNLNNLINFKFNNIFWAFLGIFLMLFINFITEKDFGKITDFFIKNFMIFHIVSISLIGVSFLSNFYNKGLLLSGVGTFLNIIPVIANGKMPVSLNALIKTQNKRVIYILLNNKSLSHGIFENPKFYFLSDIIPFYKLIGSSTVVSIGDIIISLGLIWGVIIIAKKRGA
ncbi:DUF5317 domain-containing protein [Peptoniphilus rhinitidis]|uniref:DUF5317 domain-containing protein n=2 Tax=Peptoniphilus TaxID=162289 RepID=UPI00028A40B3|nr:DUF5317 domain-containing protein [Peptoniphilus rhinitidis]MDU1043398.1 DUF5317 domain-containing protein [Peptoniphilus rhinitidis]MDU2109991.1 DUF5317 domain-containing protein [Peptoniphilus lacydonensis]MDU3751609.1 DUF5317 domain-containing protein [Peptoniphilus rhinitidis]